MARRKVPRDENGLPLPKLLVTYRCKGCGVKFKATIYQGDPDPDCPNLECSTTQTSIGFDPSTGRAPSMGGSLGVRAFDEATSIVMADQGLTNLSDAPREGDSMAPKLPIAQQRVADAVFDPAARARLFGGGHPLNRLARGAGVAGGMPPVNIQPSADYRDPIQAIHAARSSPPTHIIAGDSVKATR